MDIKLLRVPLAIISSIKLVVGATDSVKLTELTENGVQFLFAGSNPLKNIVGFKL